MGCLPSRHLRRASSSGLRIAPDGRCAGAGPVDLLVVVSGSSYLRHAHRSNARILSRLARTAQSVLGADMAAWLLAAAGLLREGRATVHWRILSDLADAFRNAYGYSIGKTRRAGSQRQRGHVAIGRDAGRHRADGAGADR